MMRAFPELNYGVYTRRSDGVGANAILTTALFDSRSAIFIVIWYLSFLLEGGHGIR